VGRPNVRPIPDRAAVVVGYVVGWLDFTLSAVYNPKQMAILIHVIIAISSIGFTTYVFVSPSEAKLKASYGLIAGTFITGTYLVVSKQARLLQTCMTGLVYLGAMTVAIAAVHYRLARARAKNNDKD
jgi:thiamine transporter ThiT